MLAIALFPIALIELSANALLVGLLKALNAIALKQKLSYPYNWQAWYNKHKDTGVFP
jgi:hypothetical protein